MQKEKKKKREEEEFLGAKRLWQITACLVRLKPLPPLRAPSIDVRLRVPVRGQNYYVASNSLAKIKELWWVTQYGVKVAELIKRFKYKDTNWDS